MTRSSADTKARRRVLLLGATGTIGQATLRALLRQGHEVVCFLRPGRELPPMDMALGLAHGQLTVRHGSVLSADSLRDDGFKHEHFDVLMSCMASRTGIPRDAWAIDHKAHLLALQVAQHCGVKLMVVLSAICVQKPKLAFQFAKLAFEQALMDSGMAYAIVRPTAYFKSLAGQIERVRQGKSFLVFGDGRLTACKPISDEDLGEYMARCIDDVSLHNRVLPIGGPGPAITPLEQGEQLFKLLGQPVRFKHVPVGLLDGIIAVLSALGRVVPALASKAELARIGRYYATESMLVWDDQRQCYDAQATPAYGQTQLFDFYADVVNGKQSVARGDHAVF